MDPTSALPFMGPLALPLEEWYVLLESRPNILIRAKKSRAEQTMFALEPHLRAEVVRWRAGQPLPPREEVGTLVVGNLETLSPSECVALEAWMIGGTARIQVVSSTEADPEWLLNAGRFPVSLYYRLNTVLLDLLAF